MTVTMCCNFAAVFPARWTRIICLRYGSETSLMDI